MEKDFLVDNTKYLPSEAILDEINANFIQYFNKIFCPALSVANSKAEIKISYDKKSIKNTITVWEKEIAEYSTSFNNIFSPDNLEIYSSILDDFKNKQFRYNLWTVKAALVSRDPDLARYKKDFGDAYAGDILDTFKNILSSAENYTSTIGKSIDYCKIKGIADLKLEFLDKEELFLKKIIGYGIRSEILHRKFPAYFPIMTQKSLWGMYFFTSVAEEFIAIEKKQRKGIMRVSHNWVYNFARFTYYNNTLCNLLFNKLKSEFEITLKPELWFGYGNLFLSEVMKIHKPDIQLLHEWTEFE